MRKQRKRWGLRVWICTSLRNENIKEYLSKFKLTDMSNDVSVLYLINKKYGIESLLMACERYFQKTGRRISFEYTLIADKNDSEEGAISLARALKKYIHSTPHVNLIPLNEVKETKLLTSKNVNNFKNKLIALGINATVRRRLGSDINASCGQLRRQSQKEKV